MARKINMVEFSERLDKLARTVNAKYSTVEVYIEKRDDGSKVGLRAYIESVGWSFGEDVETIISDLTKRINNPEQPSLEEVEVPEL